MDPSYTHGIHVLVEQDLLGGKSRRPGGGFGPLVMLLG
jgi:hypothetical protein